MLRSEFKQTCRERTPCWGTVLMEYMTPQVVRTMAQAGFDWLWVENEHAHHSYETIQEIARTADDVGIITVLRVAQAEYSLIARALDLGVGGIIVPRVETPEQARYIVDCAKYPPIGKRGFGLRPWVCGGHRTMAGRVQDQNEGRCLFLQVESRRGVENLEAMLDVAAGQVDTVVFGPADYQMDIGLADAIDAPEVDEAARHVSAVCSARGVSCALPTATPEMAGHWLERGFNLIAVGSDHGLLAGAAVQVRTALQVISPPK